MLAAKEYRLFSPFFTHEETDDESVRRVLRLINCALTNLPALDHIAPLMAATATEGDDDMECKACATLSTKLTAMEEECSALRTKLSALETASAAPAALRSSILRMTGQTTDDGALGAIEALKVSHAKVAELEKAAAVAETTRLNAEFDALLNTATDPKGSTKGAGTVSPAQVEYWKGIAKDIGNAKATAMLSGFMATATKLTGVGEGHQQTEAEKAVAPIAGEQMAALGWSAEKIKAFKADQSKRAAS